MKAITLFTSALLIAALPAARAQEKGARAKQAETKAAAREPGKASVFAEDANHRTDARTLSNDPSRPDPIQTRREELEQEIVKLRSQLRTLSDMNAGQMVQAMAIAGTSDATLTNFYPELQKSRLELDTLLASGIGQKHPQILGLRRKIKETETILVKAAENWRESLQLNITNLEKQLETGIAAEKQQALAAEDAARAKDEGRRVKIRELAALRGEAARLSTQLEHSVPSDAQEIAAKKEAVGRLAELRGKIAELETLLDYDLVE